MGALLSHVNGTKARKQNVFYRAYHINDDLGQRLLSVGIGKTQLYHLHEIFSAMDRDNSGEISLIEFFNYVDIKRSRFSEKAFSVMDRDGSGEIDFVEFVLAVWNYCSFSKASLVRYAFDLYDADGSGEIERDEASRCVREIWGDEWERNQNAQKVMGKLDAAMQTTPNERLTVQMFQEFSQRHPILLFPAFQLQTEIQNHVLGERFWRKAAAQRASVDPRELNWKNFNKMTKVSRQNSQKFQDTIDQVLETDLTGEPQRKRSSLQNVFTKVRKKKVFLDDDGGGGDPQTSAVPVSPAEYTAVESASLSTTAKTQKNVPKRPPAIDTAPPSPSKSPEAPSPTRSRTATVASSPQSTVHPTGETFTSTTTSSPSKKKNKKMRAKAIDDLVVEDVGHSSDGRTHR